MSEVITEAWLQHKAIEGTVQRLAQTACEALYGNGAEGAVVVSSVVRDEDDKWSGRVDYWSESYRRGFHDWANWTIELEGQSYIDGDVNVDHCSVPASGDPETTGQYDLVDNRDGKSEETENVSVSETDSTDVQNTFAEGVELSNKTTAEAGEGVAKIQDELTETLKIDKSKLTDKATSKTTTVTIDGTLPAGMARGIVMTDQTSLAVCDTRIGAAIDWTGIRFYVGSDGSKAFGHNTKHTWTQNLNKLLSQPRAIRESGGHHEYANIEAVNLDDWVSWMQGRNPRQTMQLGFTKTAQADLGWLAGRNNRVDFAGKQNHTNKVTSYVIHDIPSKLSLDEARTLMSLPGKNPDKVFAD